MQESIPEGPRISLDPFNLRKFRPHAKKVLLPLQLTPKLAYFIGYLQGDGCIESNMKKISFSDEYQNQLKNINSLSKELFDTQGKVIPRRTNLSKKDSFSLTIHSVKICEFLKEVFKIDCGIKKNLIIPPLIIKEKNILRWYLMGLYDADGTLPKNPEKCKQFFIDITLKDKEFIEQIREGLQLFKIRTLKPYCRIANSPNSEIISRTWELRIRKREDMRSFLKEIGFVHPNKAIRAKKLIAIMDP